MHGTHRTEPEEGAESFKMNHYFRQTLIDSSVLFFYTREFELIAALRRNYIYGIFLATK